jgi:hypothetical protein
MTTILKTLTALLIIVAAVGYFQWLADRDDAAIRLAQCGAGDSREQYAICIQQQQQAPAFPVR